MTFEAKPFGLYIHIPFCARLCHYCDFAKTANFDASHVKQYFDVLTQQLKSWLQRMPAIQFTSVFFGGGTPGLFVSEYDELLNTLTPHLTADAEVTLESNPNNIIEPALKIWKSLGINRISIGVQSFDPQGLKALTRDHSAAEALRAIALAKSMIPNVNADLIYGWPEQSATSWHSDLQNMVDLGVTHLSLYALTLEGNTPFARAHRRGKLAPKTDEFQEECYVYAMEFLQKSGFIHEEISNWSKPGFSCRHNWLYWSADSFVGIGAGAHGYIADESNFGLRYSYPGDLRIYLRECGGGQTGDGMTKDLSRGAEEWLMEYIGCGMRTEQGIDLQSIASRGWTFEPTPIVAQAITDGILSRQQNRLVLRSPDWFRETSWSGHVLDSLK